MDVFIEETIQLHATTAVVHIEASGYHGDELVFIEWNARKLLRDLPHLYKLCKDAIEKDDNTQIAELQKLRDELQKDLKK